MTRRKDGGPATPMRLRSAGFVLEQGHDDLGEDTYHDFVEIGSCRGFSAVVYRDFLGREGDRNYRWIMLHCNNPSCGGRVLRRARAIEVEVNHAFMPWFPRSAS